MARTIEGHHDDTGDLHDVEDAIARCLVFLTNRSGLDGIFA